MERKSMRVGLAAIALAAAVRLLSGGILSPVIDLLGRPGVASFFLYLETGRILRLSSPAPENAPPPQTLPTELPETTAPPATRPELAAADAELVSVFDYAKFPYDLEAMLEADFSLSLRGEEPTVLIVHTHATESYQRAGKPYTELSPFRTLDTGYNMVSIGAYMAQKLEKAGVKVIHDQGLHDHPDYNGAYNRSRGSVEEYLAKYPSIRLVLDVHRDASDDYVNQLTTHATVNGKPSSQLMLVVGTNGTGLSHDHWEDNMTMAVQLHALLEKSHPGICRPISFRRERFNQDLGKNALLIEVGAAGDTHDQALTAADALVEAILLLSEEVS